MAVLSDSIIRRWIPKRSTHAHKGNCGRILIVAGSRGMAGAAVLSATAAVRSGAGLVRLAVVQSQQSVVARRAPLEVTSVALAESRSGMVSRKAWTDLQDQLKRFRPTVMAMGPGLGTSSSVRFLVQKSLQKQTPALVLDADALNVLSISQIKRKSGPVILTPHEGELSRLLKTSATWIHHHRSTAVRIAAQKSGAVVVLKGARTLIAGGRVLWENPSGTPAMASAGMGDVLTGIISALWGQFPIQDLSSGVRAACIGVYIHGRAGELTLKKKGGLSVLATDVAEQLAHLFKRSRE